MNLKYNNNNILLASEVRKTLSGVTQLKIRDICWRVSVTSETLTGVTQLKIGDVCLFIYMFGRTYVILYFDPSYFCVRSTCPKLH